MIYPVFAIKKDCDMVYVFLRERDLKITSSRLLADGVFHNVSLIDASGLSYKIKSTYKVKELGLFNFLRKEKIILIDFVFEDEINQVDLTSFKHFVVSKIKRHKLYWEETWNISELEELIHKSNSYKEIALLLK